MRRLLLLLSLCALGGLACGDALKGYERDAEDATRELSAATTDAQRASAYSKRGRAYGEKARLSRGRKLIGLEEYARQFGLAVRDHDQAAALAPNDAEVYLNRGMTVYWRAAPTPPDGMEPDASAKPWLDRAEANFARSFVLDPKKTQAVDMLGLVHLAKLEYDAAIHDFERVRPLDERLGRLRLADAHCSRGKARGEKKLYDLAIADYERSIELGAPTDGCECDPYWPLAALYLDAKRDYDAAWRVVHAAQKGKGFVAPEFIERLKRESGRGS
jgi:hypothetical protein